MIKCSWDDIIIYIFYKRRDLMKPLVEWSNKFFDMLDMSGYDKPETAESDKLCFQNSLKQFLASGKKEDAFSVYFCFSEIFQLFGQGYENTKKLLEMLSDHEYHSGELLSKHRDHYSHSVYVFALGLAIYANDPAFRSNYLSFYHLEENGCSTLNFLKFWGMVALFHDIGYPFQLTHEQIKTYAEEVWVGDVSGMFKGMFKDKKEEEEAEKKEKERRFSLTPFVSYGNLDVFLALSEKVQKDLAQLFPDAKALLTYNDLLAYGLQKREGYAPEDVCDLLVKRVVEQHKFMDHGYFSAVIFAKQLFSLPEYHFDMQCLDVLTAIFLHNNFNKYDMKKGHPIHFEEHPLAYLIILCDELQCWDRLAYGKISKRAPIAWDFALDISENALLVSYTYDSYDTRTYVGDDLKPQTELNKNYVEMDNGTFVENIYKYVVTPLHIVVKTQEKTKSKKTNLFVSDDNFISLCDLAKAIHASYNDQCMSLKSDFISEDFGKLDLEFKVSNIEQAKSYGYKLELINCFFSRKDLDYPVVEDFNRVEANYTNNLGFLCREEHVRWVKEKLAMGWKYGTDYTTHEERNRKKIHKDIVPYEMLPDEEKSKDELMVKNILRLLKKFDSNIKIYNYRMGRKPDLEIAGTGHRFFNDDTERLKNRVKEILEQYSKTNHVIVRTCFAYGADLLIAECAIELGLTLKADLPMPVEKYIENVRQDVLSHGREFTKEDELKMRHLLAQTVVCRIVEDPKFTYAEANKYIVKNCNVLIALWDRQEIPLEDYEGRPINRGGTFDCIKMAEKAKKEIIVVDCYR